MGDDADLQAALAPSELGSESPQSPGHYGKYEFHLVAQKLQTFCSEDLGGFYLDILKDRLYTAGADSRARRSAQNALYHMTQALVRLMAPVLSFTANEVWETLNGGAASVFEQTWHQYPLPRDAAGLRARWQKLRGLRGDVQKLLEELRVGGKIGSSLAGEVDLYANGESHAFLRSFGDDLRFVFITSRATVNDGTDGAALPSSLDGVGIKVSATTHRKCERCWHYRGDVGADPAYAGNLRALRRQSVRRRRAARLRMIRWLALAALLVALDQLSKFAITRALTYGSGIEVTPFFNLVLVHNRGAAFSFLSSASGWQRELFIAIAVVASVWVVYLLRKHPRETLFCFALSLILGGAVGNVIDRLWLGAVVDFLDFHAAG